MNKLSIGIVLAVLLLLGLGAYLWNLSGVEVDDGEVFETHVAARAMITFDYRTTPQGYILIEPEVPSEESSLFQTFVLALKKEYEEFVASSIAREGPPTITLSVFENPDNRSPASWAETNPNYSNVSLMRGDFESATVGGEEAIHYLVDGLYLTKTYVVSHGEFIYLIAGSYLEEGSLIHEDFRPFVESITFITEVR